ncbi:MAG: hypothetical protein J6K02_04135 [Alistipes sp.]|jgi:hypothetical protein|uniref:hypothetical protein n=1 Tax=Alistipes sp. TaxID=1872444 RepID=UPI001B4971A4|nr:hypothetical protein [Alistipes sp.]MBP3527851.1 hypothetical protein [Alistipes sp.]
MKTYRINKNAERFAQAMKVRPELFYNISLVEFTMHQDRCIASWTPGMDGQTYRCSWYG